MDQVSPDLLLMIFKKLSSQEMVSVMRVERKWLQVIDENKALWRELVLPSNEKEEEETGWGLQALELFDQKSHSTLKRVSMPVAEEVDSGAFVETLEKSRGTLEVLELKGRAYKNYGIERAFEGNLSKFPNLVECKFTAPTHWYYRLSLQLPDRDDDQEDDEGSSLRVLWIWSSVKFLKSQIYILDNLVSLLLTDDCYDSSEIRGLLERPSRTLKHLQFSIRGGEESQISTLSFPNLELLDINLYRCSTSVFPSWMKLPSLFTLVIYNQQTLSSLPACSTLWLVDLREFDNLSALVAQCPDLVELRMDLGYAARGDDAGRESYPSERFENLLSMLSQRKVNVENGMEIQGVKTINLKILAIPFEHLGLAGETGLKEAGLSKLRESVEEVIDLREKMWGNSEIIEMRV